MHNLQLGEATHIIIKEAQIGKDYVVKVKPLYYIKNMTS